MGDSKLKKAMVHYRREFKGKDELRATLALGKDDYDKFPYLKGYDFVEIERVPTGKLQVLFV